MSLRQTQQDLLAYLRGQGPQPAGLAPASLAHVYQEAYGARHTEALMANYPAVCKLVGTRTFHDLAQDFISSHPSHSYNLNDYHPGLSVYLSREDSRWPEYTCEVARYEWALLEVFHAQALPCLRPQELQARMADMSAAADDLRFSFQPHLKLFESTWPIHKIWEQLSQAPHENNGVAGQIQVTPQHTHLALFRRDFEVYHHVLDPAHHTLLSALMAGQSLGEACEMLSAEGDNGVLNVGTWTALWMHEGWLTGAQTGP